MAGVIALRTRRRVASSLRTAGRRKRFARRHAPNVQLDSYIAAYIHGVTLSGATYPLHTKEAKQ